MDITEKLLLATAILGLLCIILKGIDMKVKEIYQEIIDQGGKCNGIECKDCPFDDSRDCNIGLESKLRCVEICQNKLRELKLKENELPKLVGKRMLVWSKDLMYEAVERIVYGRLPDGYLITAEEELDEDGYTMIDFDSFDQAKAIPEKIQIEEMTLEEVCKELGREIKIKKG